MAVVALFAASAWLPCAAQNTNSPAPPKATQQDNTKVNQRDQQATEPTADQQKETREDRQLAQNIRKSLTSDKTLSTYAHNVKVIVQNGVVTLKGPVRSEDEKSAIEAKAKEVAGADVHSEITIAPK